MDHSGSYSKGYKAWALLILCLFNLLNYVDRNVITILLEPIKTDLGISDSEAGLLAGLAFAFVYSTLGVPLARLADRGWAVRVFSGAVAVWSLMTSACGFAHCAARAVTNAPKENPISTRGKPGKRARKASASANTSSVSPMPWSCLPSLLPTPRKLKRNATNPAFCAQDASV